MRRLVVPAPEIPECRCLHGFGPYLIRSTTPPFFDGATWSEATPCYELRACDAHPSANLDAAAGRLDQALCALADVVDVLWNEGGWEDGGQLDAIEARLVAFKPRGAK